MVGNQAELPAVKSPAAQLKTLGVGEGFQFMGLETRCAKIKLKPGSLERVRQWASELNENRRDEALATLRDETVVVEAYFLDSTTEGDFLIAFMKAESFEKAHSAVKKSAHAIDKFHQRFKQETWQAVEDLETLVDLDRVDELTN